MANPEHLAILKKGDEKWNAWRDAHPDMEPNLDEVDLSQANLTRMNLRGASLRRARLHGANLRALDLSGTHLEEADLSAAILSDAIFTFANLWGADLHQANLSRANLSKANLTGVDLSATNLSLGAELSGANLRGAKLRGANLRHANLYETDLSGADLQEADLAGCLAGNTAFADIDLREAQGLDAVEHFCPSTVGVDTIFKSRGKIPEVFLRGCGVPDEFIAYIGSMVGRPIEYYSCFISYASEDQEFAERLHADLQDKGVRCWFAPHDIKGGRKIHEQIDDAIRLHDRLLLILSEDSMSSEWVKTEVAKARKREKEEKRVLFPVRLVSYEAMQSWEYIDSSGKDLAEEIRQYFIPDFSKWKEHDSYQAALGKLVGDLKSSG